MNKVSCPVFRKKFPFSRGDNLESTFSAAITQKSMA